MARSGFLPLGIMELNRSVLLCLSPNRSRVGLKAEPERHGISVVKLTADSLRSALQDHLPMPSSTRCALLPQHGNATADLMPQLQKFFESEVALCSRRLAARQVSQTKTCPRGRSNSTRLGRTTTPIPERTPTCQPLCVFGRIEESWC